MSAWNIGLLGLSGSHGGRKVVLKIYFFESGWGFKLNISLKLV